MSEQMRVSTLKKSSASYRHSLLNRLRLSSLKKKFKLLSFRWAFLLLVVAAFLYVGLGREKATSIEGGSGGSGRAALAPARGSQQLGEVLEVPVEGATYPVKFVVDKAELLDELFIKGKKATSVKGRTFLVLTIKLVNDNNTSLSFNTRNFVRLSVNGNEEEWLAPEIHNDPVEVQAISTKYTRLGFPINETDTELKLKIGKIDGEKKTISLSEL